MNLSNHLDFIDYFMIITSCPLIIPMMYVLNVGAAVPRVVDASAWMFDHQVASIWMRKHILIPS